MTKETKENILFGISIITAITAIATVWYQRKYFVALEAKAEAEIEALKKQYSIGSPVDKK